MLNRRIDVLLKIFPLNIVDPWYRRTSENILFLNDDGPQPKVWWRTCFVDDSWLSNFLALTTTSGTATADGSILTQILIVLILVLVNAFFAATEMAIVSVNNNAIRRDAEEGDKKASKLLKFIDDPGNFLATIQVGVTFAGFLSSSFAGQSFADRLAWAISSNPDGPSALIYNLSLVLVTLITSYVSIVLGELVPKQIALSNPDAFAKGVAGLLTFFDYFFKPITWLISKSSRLILRILRINPDDSIQIASEEEIRMLLDQGSKMGSIHSEESQMIVNVFEFNDKEVSEIMTHRTNVIALDVLSDYEDTLDVAIHEKYSRIPVYNEDIDDIIGILHIKDLLYYVSRYQKDENFDLRTLLREPYWVPESKNVDELFREMQSEHISMAVVIDEYGGTAGIVTIEDILEEIVGNIQDEYDEEDYDINQVDDNCYEMSGLLNPEDINRVLEEAYFPDEEEADYDTIAGLMIGLLARIPEDDEQPEIDYRNMTFKVLSMDDKRIDRLRLRINKTVKEYEEEQRILEEERKENERSDKLEKSERESEKINELNEDNNLRTREGEENT